MFFTQEDYRKIEKWLLANSRKDTDFAGAATPLKGNEILAIVQNGQNMKVSLKDFIDQLFLLGVSDFVNITDKYGESYLTLSQAIQLIPFRSRKIGQVITFLDDNGEWRLYQFQGERVNQWNNTTLWIDLIAALSGISIIDSEDIIPKANVNNQVSLLFADKNYNTTEYSGLGRVYLRKNIQTVVNPNTGITYSTNLLTQQMLNKENTIYVLQYDYNLNGQTITIPSGCVLLFEGGSISNGTLKGSSTIILGETNHIFINLNVLGTWGNSFKLSYFNKPELNYDSFIDIQKGINAIANTPNKFIIDIDCWGSSFVFVPSNTHILINSTITKTAPEGGFSIFPKNADTGGFDSIKNVIIEGDGILDQNTRNTNDVSASFIRCYHASNITIKNLTFKDSANYHYIELGAVDRVLIDGCSFLGHRYITDPSLPAKQHGGECIQIEYTEADSQEIKRDYLECRNVSITNCLFDGMYHFENNQKVYDTYNKTAIGCHSDTVDGVERNPHLNITISNNTFENIQDLCIGARYMNNSKFVNNKAFNLKGMFVGGAFANPDLLKTYYNFDNSVISGNEVYYDATLTEIVEIPAISDITRKVRGAIELYGCNNTIIEDNSIYNSPIHVLYIANSPNTTIKGNTFEGWNTIDKNNGALSYSGRCFFIADENITEGTVRDYTSNLSISGNFVRDSYTGLEVRIFYRNREPLDTTLSIIGNVVEVPKGVWDLYGFSMLENTIIFDDYSRPYYPPEDKGIYFLEDNKFIVWDGELWRNSDGTWINRVTII